MIAKVRESEPAPVSNRGLVEVESGGEAAVEVPVMGMWLDRLDLSGELHGAGVEARVGDVLRDRLVITREYPGRRVRNVGKLPAFSVGYSAFAERGEPGHVFVSVKSVGHGRGDWVYLRLDWNPRKVMPEHQRAIFEAVQALGVRPSDLEVRCFHFAVDYLAEPGTLIIDDPSRSRQVYGGVSVESVYVGAAESAVRVLGYAKHLERGARGRGAEEWVSPVWRFELRVRLHRLERRPRWDGDADGRLIDCIDWHRTRLGDLADLEWPLKRTVVRRCEPEGVADTELAGFMLAARWGGLRSVKDWLKRRRSKAWKERLTAAMEVVRPQPEDVFAEWWPRVVDRDVGWAVNEVEGWECAV